MTENFRNGQTITLVFEFAANRWEKLVETQKAFPANCMTAHTAPPAVHTTDPCDFEIL